MLKKIGEDKLKIWIDLDETIWYTVKKVLEDNKIKVWNTLIKEKEAFKQQFASLLIEEGVNVNE